MRTVSWRGRLLRMDPLLAGAIFALCIAGVFFIRSAGMHSPLRAGLYVRQIGWVVIGSALFIGVALADYRRVLEQAVWIYLIGLGLLALVLISGDVINGARRWLKFFGTPVQPSEIAKISTVLMLARLLGRPDLDPRRFSVIWKAALVVVPPFILIAVEPDLGTAAVLIPVTAVMLFLAGVPFRTLALLALPVAGAAAMVGWMAVHHPDLGESVLDEYQLKRIRVFLGVERDPLGAGWNKIQSGIAVGSGGMWGKGYGAGTQNTLGYLPQTVAPTDFIFSVIGEETGFAGSAALLALYTALLAGGLRAAGRAPDRGGRLLAAGLATLVFTHVFVNIAMTIGLMPITGLPLPLISYGGSVTVATMLGLGLMQSVGLPRRRSGAGV
ncbi:MAG: rod shape-determining protein RodA [Kiritimatiellae bacterium]|nr:rod shape-determining protein RodA [Kiritimatiellia bacterium]